MDTEAQEEDSMPTKFTLDCSDYDTVPQHTKDALARYVEHRIPPGGFLEAVLTNDLFRAVSRADIWNQNALADIVRFIYNRCPVGCHGSRENYEAWLEGPEREAGEGGLDTSWLNLKPTE